MPGDLSGIDVVLCVRFMWPELSVIFVTGSSDVLENIDVPTPQSGCVAKPYALGDLLAMIGITSRSTQNRTPADFQDSLSLAFQLDLRRGHRGVRSHGRDSGQRIGLGRLLHVYAEHP